MAASPSAQQATERLHLHPLFPLYFFLPPPPFAGCLTPCAPAEVSLGLEHLPPSLPSTQSNASACATSSLDLRVRPRFKSLFLRLPAEQPGPAAAFLWLQGLPLEQKMLISLKMWAGSALRAELRSPSLAEELGNTHYRNYMRWSCLPTVSLAVPHRAPESGTARQRSSAGTRKLPCKGGWSPSTEADSICVSPA